MSGRPYHAPDESEGRPPAGAFLDSHRAVAACAREFTRLSAAIVMYVEAFDETMPKPVVRQSPERCIVQLGPVALTVAWLRSTLDSVADGELLIIVWHGLVAPTSVHGPVTGQARAPSRAATSLWEEVFQPAAETPSDWAWRSVAAKSKDTYSAELLAQRCVEQLRLAFEKNRASEEIA